MVTGVESTGYGKKSACKFFIVHENSSTGPTNFDYGVGKFVVDIKLLNFCSRNSLLIYFF